MCSSDLRGCYHLPCYVLVSCRCHNKSHKRSGLKQHEALRLQFCRSEVCSGSHPHRDVSQAAFLFRTFWEVLEETPFLAFSSLLEAARVPWFMTTPPLSSEPQCWISLALCLYSCLPLTITGKGSLLFLLLKTYVIKSGPFG